MAIKDLMELLALREAQQSQLGGAPARQPPRAPAPPALPSSPGMGGVDRIFATPGSPKTARSLALLNAGLTLAATRGSTAEGLLNALQAGTQSYAGFEQARAAEAERQAEAEAQQRDAEVRQQFGEQLQAAQGPEDVLSIARQMAAAGYHEEAEVVAKALEKKDEEKASVESDSAYKTALSEFAATKFGKPVDIHELQLTPAEALGVQRRADQIRLDAVPKPAATPTPEKTLGPEITSALVVERNNAEGALRVINTTQEAGRLLASGVFTGAAAPAVTSVANALEQFGLLSGRGGDRLTATQEYLATVSDLVLAEVQRAGSGGLRGLTDAEREWLTAAYGGNIRYTDRALFSIARKLNQRARQQVQDYVRRADTITRPLSPEQQEFYRLPGAERLAPSSGRPSVDDIMRGRIP